MTDTTSRPLSILNKVPEVMLAFWVIKIMSTTVGETGADYLAVHVGLGVLVTDALMLSLLIAALLMQLAARRYSPWRYWLTVVLVSIVGTQITDFLTDTLDVSLYVSTTVFSVALGLAFSVWYFVERTLSIHTIVTRRRELFYWTAILCTFALGTARVTLRPRPYGWALPSGSLRSVHLPQRSADPRLANRKIPLTKPLPTSSRCRRHHLSTARFNAKSP